MNPLSKGFELFSFEFSLPQSSSSIECPNCGYQICSNIFQKVNISKTFILFCCGSIVYWNLIKDQNSRISLILSSTKNFIQNGITNLFLSLTPPSSSTSPIFDEKFIVDQSTTTTTNIFNQCSSSSNYSVVNQLIVNNNSNNNNDEHYSLSSQNDYSSINLSPLNSIGNCTLAKLEGMLDDVEEIKMYVNDSCNEIGWYTGGAGGQTEFINILQRRVSDGEITTSLPSLEWDLNDINFDSNHNVDDNDSFDDGQSSNINFDFDEQNSQQQQNSSTTNENYSNLIDNETLSRIIFNKNFEFKDEQFFRSKKQFINLKQRLKFLTKSQQQQHQRNHRNNGNHRFNNNINSNNYRSNRDSAFFEDL
ncbi:hypothetical protein DERP_009437 [Dermatophagoides pteronyssinus]|uniref:Uncharacterized protein n=1 Tax=Dermatophagoides pteronyssinus TaxID=6956 RepID=A0ABQ8IU43_DERPT|nr:hypothetical protein DERP_009437 [Dermatophagoides pteronyssinus]